ncbi:MAG TPA: ABC transporter ATP-binding protein, partial [Streptosporangiaceae bacterium]|nr:ABC transporter ATP-binding protein [Streptosporangiaceae bacterium]
MSLTTAGLSVDIGGRRIVDDVDIAVPDGRFVGLLGPNGSGKSTVLKAIYRVRRPSAGRVLLDGSDLLAMGHKAAARRV